MDSHITIMKNSLFALFFVSCWSCTTLKPDSSGVSTPDFNRRVEIDQPRNYRSINPVGIGSIVAGTLGGGYAGYRSQAISYNDGTAQKSFAVGNVLMGAVVGYSMTYLGNRLFGWGKTQRVTNSDEYRRWLSKANTNYRLLSSNSSGSIRAIHSSADSNFTVKTLADAQDFRQAFGNSSYTGALIDQIVDNKALPRSNFPDLVKTFAGAPNVIKLKKEYITQSTTIAQLLEGADKYPDTKLPIEVMAVDIVKNCKDAEIFRSRYPESLYGKQLVVNALQGCSTNETRALSQNFNRDFRMSSSEFNKLKLTDGKKAGYFNAQFVINPPKRLEGVFSRIDSYGWIDYPDKPTSILTQLWNVGYSEITDGDELVYFMRQLSMNSTYRQYKISTLNINQFLREKLDEEIKNHVVVISSNILKPASPEWNNWQTSDFTAAFVKVVGLRKFLIHGEIENRSRFTLPIKIVTGGTLLESMELKGSGSISEGTLELAKNLYRRGTGQEIPTKHLVRVGNMEEAYIFPDLRPRERTLYATLLNFGEKPNYNVNIGDVYRYLSSFELTNVSQTLTYNSEILSQKQRTDQIEWAKFAKTGLPEATVHDFLRGGEKVTKEKWKERLREQQAAIEAARKQREQYTAISSDQEEEEKERKKNQNDLAPSISYEVKNKKGCILYQGSKETFKSANKIDDDIYYSVLDDEGKKKNIRIRLELDGEKKGKYCLNPDAANPHMKSYRDTEDEAIKAKMEDPKVHCKEYKIESGKGDD